MKVVLCILFNQPFPRNIPKLEQLYASRFPDMMFVQPILASARRDVVVSYRGSYNFQGMYVDALPALEARGADYVVFLQDDGLLNPALNAGNILEWLEVREDVPFFDRFLLLPQRLDEWYWSTRVLWNSFYNQNPLVGTGVEDLFRHLPDSGEARRHLSEHYGLAPAKMHKHVHTPAFSGLLNDAGSVQKLSEIAVEGLFKTAPPGGVDWNYPWIRGMSDFAVLSLASLRRMATFLGATAAANVFVEVALPTAMALFHTRVSNPGNTPWWTEYVWDAQRDAPDAKDIADKFARSCALFHPVKLSRHFDALKSLFEI